MEVQVNGSGPLIEVGQWWYPTDPRLKPRAREVVAVNDSYVVLRGLTTTRVRLLYRTGALAWIPNYRPATDEEIAAAKAA